MSPARLDSVITKIRCPALALVGALAVACTTTPPPAVSPPGSATPADLVLLGGRIFTGDPERPWAEAVAIEGERIAAIGSDEEIRPRVGAGTRVIALENRLVIPGINDAHVHEPWQKPSGAIEIPPDVTRDALIDLLRRAAATAPPNSWITGRIPAAFLDAGLTRADLDTAAPAHHVRLAVGAHGALLGTSALRALGIVEGAADPPGGRFGRGPDGALNGWVFEYPLWQAARRAADDATDEAFLASLRSFEDEALRFGITSVQTFPILPAERMQRLLKQLKPKLRWRVIDFRMPPFERPQGRHAVKYVLDGTPVERGAALREPYADRPGYSGTLNLSPAELDAVVRDAARGERQLHVHVSGSAAAAALLETMQRVSSSGWPARRVRIEHGDLLTDDQLDAIARLGIVVVQNPSHFSRPELVAARFGPGRVPQFARVRSLAARGVPLALGSDGPLNPYLNLMFAVVHAANPREALTLEQAVAAYTKGAAFAEHAEQHKGTLAPGMLADLAVLSQDIFSAPPSSLPRTESVMTIVGGQVRWEAPEPPG